MELPSLVWNTPACKSKPAVSLTRSFCLSVGSGASGSQIAEEFGLHELAVEDARKRTEPDGG